MVDHVNRVRCMSIYDSLNRLQERELWEEGDGSLAYIHIIVIPWQGKY